MHWSPNIGERANSRQISDCGANHLPEQQQQPRSPPRLKDEQSRHTNRSSRVRCNQRPGPHVQEEDDRRISFINVEKTGGLLPSSPPCVIEAPHERRPTRPLISYHTLGGGSESMPWSLATFCFSAIHMSVRTYEYRHGRMIAVYHGPGSWGAIFTVLCMPCRIFRLQAFHWRPSPGSWVRRGRGGRQRTKTQVRNSH
ncbi:hypothetical protein LZ30DRAFT_473930 [Colletotrichum cereale]|nr:hypothetical protein LZ30DRAFT_473930 [Colletotrichum cereale]